MVINLKKDVHLVKGLNKYIESGIIKMYYLIITSLLEFGLGLQFLFCSALLYPQIKSLTCWFPHNPLEGWGGMSPVDCFPISFL